MANEMITGNTFLKWLSDNDIIPKDTRRVVIDASYDSAVLMYIEKFGTKKIIEVKPPEDLDKAVKVILNG